MPLDPRILKEAILRIRAQIDQGIPDASAPQNCEGGRVQITRRIVGSSEEGPSWATGATRKNLRQQFSGLPPRASEEE